MKKILSVILAIACLLSLAACGTNTDSTANETQGNQQTWVPTQEQISYKKTVTVAIDKEPETLDNHSTTGNYSIPCFRMVYDTLFKVKIETSEVYGWLVKEYDLSDPLNLKMTLRDDVYFSNGEKMTSEDVRWSIARQKEVGVGASFVASIDTVEVVDDTHFIFHMSSADASLLPQLTSPRCSIQWHGSLDSGSWQLIGSGPYTLEKWVSGDSITFARRDNYWAGAVPSEKVVLKIMPELSSRIIALQAHEVDLCMDLEAGSVPALELDSSLQILSVPCTGAQVMVFQVGDENRPLHDKAVRHAIKCAINTADLIDAVEDGLAKKTNQLVADGVLYAFGDFEDAYEYDVDRAKKILADAGYKDGDILIDYICKAEDTRLIGEILQDQLKKVGIVVDIHNMDGSGYNDAYNKGEFDIAVTLKTSSTGDPGVIFKDMLSWNTGKGGNRSYYNNPEYDELYKQQMAAMDPAERERICIELQKILMDDMPRVPLYSPLIIAAGDKKLGGFIPNAADMHDFTTIYCGE